MRYSEIVSLINKKIVSEQLTYDRIKDHMDAVIDDINSDLNSKFPTFTELAETIGENAYVEYNCFPDRYIRTVVVTGAAAKWFTADEEGIETATTYVRDYERARFLMLRDFSYELATNPNYAQYVNDTVGAIPDYAPDPMITYTNIFNGVSTGRHISVKTLNDILQNDIPSH